MKWMYNNYSCEQNSECPGYNLEVTENCNEQICLEHRMVEGDAIEYWTICEHILYMN